MPGTDLQVIGAGSIVAPRQFVSCYRVDHHKRVCAVAAGRYSAASATARSLISNTSEL